MLSIAYIQAAASTLEGIATRTPLLEFAAVNDQLGGRVFFKPECLQRKGAFKFRGAYNALAAIPADKKAGGVVACSSGNHAQGVAEAARLLGMPAAIVMPSDAPKVKIEGTKQSGADIIFYDRYSEDREAIAKTICTERGAAFIHPFNDPLIMAGQGTLGLEIAQDLTDLGLSPDKVLVPVSGGGLAAGVSIAIHQTFPKAQIFGCEPEGHDDLAASLKAGKPSLAPEQEPASKTEETSYCDALLAPMPGDNSFAVMKDHLTGAVTATNDDIIKAVGFALKELHLVVEPGGAIGLACLLNGAIKLDGGTAVIVLSGGNVDADFLKMVLES